MLGRVSPDRCRHRPCRQKTCKEKSLHRCCGWAIEHSCIGTFQSYNGIETTPDEVNCRVETLQSRCCSLRSIHHRTPDKDWDWNETDFVLFRSHFCLWSPKQFTWKVQQTPKPLAQVPDKNRNQKIDKSKTAGTGAWEQHVQTGCLAHSKVWAT